MNKLKIIIFLSIITLFWSCKEDILFDTIEADAPTVSDTAWSADGVSFAGGGRTFRLTNPLDTLNPWTEIDFKVTINSNDERRIDSIDVELQHIPSFASNSPQGWAFYEGIKIPDAEQSSNYTLDYKLNLNDWSESYWGPENFWIGTGVFGITREDNTMRLRVHFDDGSNVRLAQVMFSYELIDDTE